MSFVCCNEETFEDLVQYTKKAISFVDLHKDIVNAYVSNFFVKEHWKDLPLSWRETLKDMDTMEMATLLSNSSGNMRKVLPLSLLSFKACTQTYSLDRKPVDLNSQDVQQKFVCGTGTIQTPTTKLLLVQVDGTDKGTIKDQIKDGQYLPLNYCYRKHVKPKKQHEILQLGQMINLVSNACGTRHIVDVGAGQGHLSRLLSFGHNLKVTTIEASGCHAPKAEKYDRDMSYTVRTHLKRKLKESNSCESPEKADITEVSHLPNHVTCRIQPNTTPAEFLNVVDTKTKETSCKDPSEESIEDSESQTSDGNGENLILTGLHACGDLSTTILRVFSRSPDIKGVVSVGCCYMKMSTSECNENRLSEDFGYPMSEIVSSISTSGLSYEAREMACHSSDVYRQRLMDSPPHLKLHCYRAMLQEVILHHDPDFPVGSTKLTIKKAEQMDFRKYAIKALEKIGLHTNIDEDFLQTTEKNLEFWKDVVAFYTIRLSLAPVVETIILLDRMLYLKEQGISSYLLPVFDPELSPRNFALVAYK